MPKLTRQRNKNSQYHLKASYPSVSHDYGAVDQPNPNQSSNVFSAVKGRTETANEVTSGLPAQHGAIWRGK
jgi:hypothetical protein